MAAKLNTSVHHSANGHVEMTEDTTSLKQERVAILDAGAQYGKVSLYNTWE